MAPKAKASKQASGPTKAKSSQQPSKAAADQQKLPNWPLVTPLPSSEDLSFDTLLSDQILTVPGFWTSTLCKTYINFLKTLPLTTTPGKPKRGDAVRVNDRFQVQDGNFAERLWNATGLREMVLNPIIDGQELSKEAMQKLWGGEVLGLNPNIRVYRYSQGQFFDQHYDDSNNISFQPPDSDTSIAAKTTWTLLLYLSSPVTGCEGGQTVFYPDPPSKREAAPPPVIAELEVGMLLLHRHGKDCLLHEGREVTAGEKWIVRSDLCVKR